MTDQIVTGVYKDATMNDKHAYDEYSMHDGYDDYAWNSLHSNICTVH